MLTELSYAHDRRTPTARNRAAKAGANDAWYQDPFELVLFAGTADVDTTSEHFARDEWAMR